MSDKNGGPAFPNDWEAKDMGSTGMTLRDYAALKVLPVLVANPETGYDEDVADALLIADKYLRARGGAE